MELELGQAHGDFRPPPVERGRDGGPRPDNREWGTKFDQSYFARLTMRIWGLSVLHFRLSLTVFDGVSR